MRPPGSAIDDKEVAKQFDASRTPVREALLMLSAQGLVDIAPRAGIYVHRPTAAELVATIEALTELEAVVAGLAARRATKELCDALSKAQAKGDACAVKNDRKGYEVANAELHGIIYAASGNFVLVNHIKGVRKMLAAYRKRGFDKPGRLAVSSREHAEIVDAIIAGNDAAAVVAMKKHIGVGGEAMVALVLAAEANLADSARPQ